MFWSATFIFVVGNALLAWGTTFKKLDPMERPSVLREGWFQVATLIGGVGWLAVPVMFYWKYGFLGAALGWLGFVLIGWILAFALKGVIEASIGG